MSSIVKEDLPQGEILDVIINQILFLQYNDGSSNGVQIGVLSFISTSLILKWHLQIFNLQKKLSSATAVMDNGGLRATENRLKS